MSTDRQFDEIYRRTRPSLSRYVARRVVGESADVVDDVFLTAWRRRTDIPREEDSQLMWLYAIARRKIANLVRWRSRLDRFHQATNPLAEVTVSHLSSETSILVHDCLRRLTKNDREILLLIEWDGCTVREAATVLNITEGAATKRIKHARESFVELYSASSTE